MAEAFDMPPWSTFAPGAIPSRFAGFGDFHSAKSPDERFIRNLRHLHLLAFERAIAQLAILGIATTSKKTSPSLA